MNNLTEAQKNALKDIAILAAIYFGTKATSAMIRYAIIGGVGYLLYQNMNAQKQGMAGLQGGWQMKVDPSMAVDMLFPKMKDTEKTYAKLAASHVLNGLFGSRGY